MSFLKSSADSFIEKVKCNVCKKIHKRTEIDKWVYHSSFGVVCLNHYGVKEWYEKLFSDASLKLAGEK